MSMIFILGADDPEMSAIEQLLTNHGVGILYAADASGKRVTPGTAYKAEALLQPDGALLAERTHDIADIVSQCVVVECDFPGITPVARCDHHFPGDPGYGKPPADYWEASSIGQVAALLDGNNGWDIANSGSVELLMVAAADHCLAAAYAGQCYGVDPAALAEFRIRQRAEFQKRDVAELRADMERALGILANAPRITIDGSEIADMRGTFVPELPDAALIAGLPGYLASVTEPGGRQKVVISANERNVRAFMEGWAAQNGLTEIYGNPVRGYAGGYVL